MDTSADGRKLVVRSTRPDVIQGQVDPESGGVDSFHVDTGTGVVQLITHTGDGVTAANVPFEFGSAFPRASISDDGSTVLFTASGAPLVRGVAEDDVTQD